jgi:dipeptidase E
MSASILMASTNLAVPWLAGNLRGVVQGCTRAMVVTNAEPRRAAGGGDLRLALEALRRAGIAEVGLLDVLTDQPPHPATCDCVCLAGGNPYHLLHCLRETGADDAIDEMVAAGRPVVAAGLAACVLGRTIAHLRDLGLSVPAMGCRDVVALGLLPFSVLPSANRWRASHRDFTATVKRVEARHGRLVTLDDDEALRFGEDGVARVRSP